jgi:hypothetical protein
MEEHEEKAVQEMIQEIRNPSLRREDPDAGLRTQVREAINGREAMRLYLKLVEAMAEKVLSDSEIELDDGLQEFENAIYILRKAYGI